MQPREWAARCPFNVLSSRAFLPSAFQEEERNLEGPRSSLEEEEEVEGGRFLDSLREIPPKEESIVSQLIVFDETRQRVVRKRLPRFSALSVPRE